MKTRRKFNQCPNCGQMLDRTDNYCPRCGQENDDKNISANILFSEFIGTYFSLDSTFIRSFKPFLLKPGYLTNQFNSGKRRSFANPVRLYLIMSIFYFFIVSIFGMKVVDDDGRSYEIEKGSSQQSNGQHSDENYASAAERDSVLREVDRISKMWESDTIKYDTNKDKDSSDIIFNRINWQLVYDLKHDEAYSDQDVLDSMKLGNLTYTENYVARQIIRINRSDTESVLRYLLQNLPLMMLAVIPLFALMLKLVYVRSKTLYVKHIIHALHLHSFAYFIYGIGLLVFIYVFKGDMARIILWIIGYSAVFVYAVVSFKNVYRQSLLKTLFKFFLVGAGYSILVFSFFILEAALSFLFY